MLLKTSKGLIYWTIVSGQPLSRYQSKAKGKWVHNQLRMTQDQWELARQFAMSERVSLNKLALLGISRLRQEKGLPPLPDLG